MSRVLVDGKPPTDPALAISTADRGLNYGDGLFQTMLYRGGKVRYLDAHMRRLSDGCRRLGIGDFAEPQLRAEIEAVCSDSSEGVVKVVITRGAGGRGYRPAADLCATRIVSLHPLPVAVRQSTVNLRWCEMRLGRNATLAGMKHLNRLEQVLAQREWDDPSIDEGLLLDCEGELISATMSNVFIVQGNAIATPDLRFCGVRGVMRDEVLRIAGELGISARETALWPSDIETADEVFITNAVRGVRGVASIGSRRWTAGPITEALATAVSKQ